jgi:hypothetical protein
LAAAADTGVAVEAIGDRHFLWPELRAPLAAWRQPEKVDDDMRADHMRADHMRTSAQNFS